MPHCRFCLDIPFRDLPNENEEGFPHQPTLDALRESAKSCKLCKLILWAAGCYLTSPGGIVMSKPSEELPDGRKFMTQVFEGMYDTKGVMRGFSNGAVVMNMGSAQAELGEPRSVDLDARFPRGSYVRPWLYGNWYISPYRDRHPLLVGLGIRLGKGAMLDEAEGNSETDVFIKGDVFGSEIAFQRVHKWVEECDRGHDCDKNHSCGKNRDSPIVPTRLLEVSRSGETIRVVQLGEQRDHYLALSHSWGLSHRITTTKGNIVKHREGINVAQLPPTFKEAVLIARKLDISYLWIDSLCIIQDDFSDWEHEVSRMGNVYAHAYLTISALSSADDASGCFRNGCDIKFASTQNPHISCDSWTTGFTAIPLAAGLVIGERDNAVEVRRFREMATLGDPKSRLYVTCEWMPPSLKDDPKYYLVGRFGREVDPFEHEPLNKRAWTLQERLLSPRTLHYGSQEMYWECQYCVLCEDGALMTREFPTMEKVVASRYPSGGDQPRHDIWHKLVQEYTGRHLTRDQDKLPALSGLANLMASKTGDRYMAGLWGNNIIKDLYWSVEINEPSHRCDDSEHDATIPPATKAIVKRPAQYRAPSWSWAALDGKIEYSHLNEKGIQARCLDIQLSPAGKDKFGRVQLGWMIIEGPLYLLHQVEWEKERYKRVFKFTISVELQSGTRTKKFGSGHAKFDDETCFPSFALMLDNEHALILRANGMRTFTRIGTVSLVRMSEVNHPSTSAGLVMQGKNESEKLGWSVEDEQAAGIADGSPQIVTLF